MKYYHLTDKGLEEGEALGRISVVLKADYQVMKEKKILLEIASSQVVLAKESADARLKSAVSYIMSLRGLAHTKGGLSLDSDIDSFLYSLKP